MELKIIAKNTGMLTSTKVVGFIVGIIRAKINALLIGPKGIGTLNQLQDILNKIGIFSLLSMQNGATKLIAQNNAKNDYMEIASVIKTFAVIVIPIAFAIYVAGLFTSGQLTELILGDSNYHKYLLIAFVAIPFMIIKSIPSTILTGFKAIKFLALGELIIIIAGFICFLPLVYFFKLNGVIFIIPLTFIFTFIVYVYFAKHEVLKSCKIHLKNVLKAEFKKNNFKAIFAFAGMGVITAPVALISAVFVRSTLANTVGIGKIGIYNPILAWSNLFQGFIIPSIHRYLFPRISEAQTNTEITLIVNDVIRLISFFLTPFVLLAIAFREIVIQLFYSKEFLLAADLLPYHFLGLFFVVLGWAMGSVFQPTGRLKLFTIFMTFLSILNPLLVYFLVPRYGLYGWLATFTVTPVIMSIIYYITLKREIKFYIKKENIQLLIFALAAGIFLAFNPFNQWISYGLSIVLCGITYFFLKDTEKTYLKEVMFHPSKIKDIFK